MEQLNIEGKRSGQGFVAHKAMLVNALSRAIADRVTLNGVTLGRKGLLNYFRALGGSNTSYLADSDWIGDKTPLTFCEVRVSPYHLCWWRLILFCAHFSNGTITWD